MADEYNDLENLIHDVTNIDTARMTLRWALERLNSMEKERADLKKKLHSTEEKGSQLERKLKSLEESMESRTKILDEKEGFYHKLEATMALLGEGKLNIEQLLQKEARFEKARKELDEEYQRKFEELDKTQNSVISRWNQRILDVETQYAQRLSTAQSKYDNLRHTLDAEHQARLTSLEKAFFEKEKELAGRIKFLENSLKSNEQDVDKKTKEIEAEFLAKKSEIERNHHTLKSLLESNFEARIRSVETEQAEHLRNLEGTWKAERDRLLEEQRMREEQFNKAQDKIKEIENMLAIQQERHHGELIERLGEKERLFKEKINQLEDERVFHQEEIKKLMEKMAEAERNFHAEKENFKQEYIKSRIESENLLAEKVAELERDFTKKRENLDAEYLLRTENFEKEILRKAEADRKALESERNRMLAEVERARKDFEKAQAEITVGIEENKSLKEQLLKKEADFNNQVLKIQQENEQKALEKIKDAVASERQKHDTELEKNRALMKEISEMEEKHKKELMSIENNIISGRVKELEAEYEERKALMEQAYGAKFEKMAKDINAEIENEKKAWNAEKEKFEILLAGSRVDFEKAQKEVSGLTDKNRALEEKSLTAENEFNRKIMEFKSNLEREYNLRLENAVQAQTEHVFDDLDFLRRRNDELSRTLKFKEEELESVKGDLASVERKWSEKMRNLERDVIAGKAAEIEEQFRQEKAKIEAQYQGRADELEQEYLRKCGELDKTFEYKCELLNQEMSDLKNTAAFLRKELSASQVKINELENEVILRERAAAENAGRALSEKLKITEQHLLRAEEEYKKELAACYAKFNELEDELMSNRREYKEDLDRKEKIHLEETDVKIRGAVSRATEAMSEKLRMAEEALMSLEDESRREITGLHERLGQVENELISRQREYQEKTAQAEKTHMEEMDMKVKEAVSKAVEALSEKLRIAEEELIRIAEDSRKEVTFLEDSFRSEKERLLEEIERREKQIEALLSEQMDGSAREKQFREQITNCEKQMADKEIQMAEHKRNIEKGYIKKMAEIEELKTELTKAIARYKAGKQ